MEKKNIGHGTPHKVGDLKSMAMEVGEGEILLDLVGIGLNTNENKLNKNPIHHQEILKEVNTVLKYFYKGG